MYGRHSRKQSAERKESHTFFDGLQRMVHRMAFAPLTAPSAFHGFGPNAALGILMHSSLGVFVKGDPVFVIVNWSSLRGYLFVFHSPGLRFIFKHIRERLVP
jgi:hypothetical protein